MTDWDFSFYQIFHSLLQLLFYPSKYFQLYVQTFMGVSEMNPMVPRKLGGIVDRQLCITFEKSQQSKCPVTGKREILHQFSKRMKRTIGTTSQSASSLFGKIMEEILMEARLRHVNDRKGIPDRQNSFRMHKSPLNYLLAFCNEVME